jgi:hypothetical protein
VAIDVTDDGAPNITYLFTDNFGNRIATLPLTSVTWSYQLCGAGQMSGTLAVEDPRVQRLPWQTATSPNLACAWVDVNGALVWGGRVTSHDYDSGAGTVKVGATDFVSYLAQRLQAADYSTTWSTVASQAGAAQIAYRILSDVLAVPDSLPVAVSVPAPTPAQYAVTLAAPISQRQTADSLVSMLSRLGYQVGFDYACDVAYAGGVPTATITLSYPRRGRVAGSTGLVVNTGAAHTGLRWTVDGTRQATVVSEMATSGGGVPATGVWEPAMSTYKYPLLEAVTSHTMFSAAQSPATVLQAFVENDLMLYAFPVVNPQITVPTFANPPIGSWIVGDDVRVIVPKRAGGGPPTSPRFPNGLDVYLRMVKATVTIPDAGLPTTLFEFNLPPSQLPQAPPV